MKSFLSRQWFLVALAAALTIGFAAAEHLRGFADKFPVWALVATVLFLMSWTLDARAMWRSVRYPQAAILGVAVNFGFLPIFAWIVSHILPDPLNRGLILTAAVPSTLASAAVWTRRAGGNDAVALVVTMITNFSCFLVTPMILWLFAGTEAKAEFDFQQRMVDLLLIAVLPMVVGQLVRAHRPSASWATAHRSALSTIAQCGILTMVLIGAIKSAIEIDNSSPESALGASAWVNLMVAVSVLHVTALAVGFMLGKLARLSRPDWIAVGFSGSQKTLMIGLQIAVAENMGLGMLPMVAYHAAQLLIDTLVADRLRRETNVAPQEAASASPQ